MTHKGEKSQKPFDDAPSAICQAVEAALRQMGWQMPDTADQVEQAEKMLADQPIPLPAELEDPKAVFGRPTHTPATIPFPTSPEIDATLSRAAREAGHITPEVRQRMRRDRQAAQRQQKKSDSGEEDSHGPDVR